MSCFRSDRLELGRKHTFVLKRPTTALRVTGALFELEKAFLLPGAMPAIRELARIHGSQGSKEVLVVGHADPSGSEAYNLGLSLERAQAMAAFLRDDADAWLSFYAHGDADSRWGSHEDRAMLQAVPDADGNPYARQHGSVADAVRRFQTDSGLAVDGICGPKTRRVLISAYMALDGTSLSSDTRVVAHGCGEFFPEGETAEMQRRVELFYFPKAIDPVPAAETSEKGSTDYSAWKERVSKTIDLSVDVGPEALEFVLYDREGQPMQETWYQVVVDSEPVHCDRADFRAIARFDRPSTEKLVIAWGSESPDGPFRYLREVFGEFAGEDEVMRKLHNLGHPADVDLAEAAISFQAIHNIDDHPVPTGLLEDVLPAASLEKLHVHFEMARKLALESA